MQAKIPKKLEKASTKYSTHTNQSAINVWNNN